MKIFTLVTLLFSLNSIAQVSNATRNVDYKAIEKEITNKKSPYFFEHLKERFIALDTTLTIDDFHHLYYGSTIQNDYNVNRRHTIDEKISGYYNSENISTEQWKEIAKYNEKVLKNDLFIDLNVFDALIAAYHYTGDSEKNIKLSNLFDKLLGAMLETGNGFSQATAMDVISTSHEYYMMNILEFPVSGQQLLRDDEGRSYDLLTIKHTNTASNADENIDEESTEEKIAENGKLKGLYFDVTRLFELYAKMFN
ncbi:DUF4919 domain-containing protein [Flavobacterium sp. CBA20B-1]|uniref:DUF4919 domain-containing protein n=1 Tax=unclassified Flavobacterium TaxID=196869 RepID=UPI002224F0AE|nr:MULTISPECIES: DUF4919 domain-containing protein [unclassified Flavobacterium]WCM41843.1 DUF4919 domain-containing protein [Flavobacterium sp. CBA20B-1]